MPRTMLICLIEDGAKRGPTSRAPEAVNGVRRPTTLVRSARLTQKAYRKIAASGPSPGTGAHGDHAATGEQHPPGDLVDDAGLM